MGKSAPDPAPSPDPTQTAATQAQANLSTAIGQTALNNTNIRGPNGGTTYKVTGSQEVPNVDGTMMTVPTYTQVNYLSPAQRQLLQQNNALSSQMNGIAGQALNNVSDQLSHPMTMSSFNPIQSSAGLQNTYDAGGNIQKDVNLGMASTNAPTTFGQTAGQIQYGLGNTDFTADRDASTNAVLQRLAPSIAARTNAMQANLANQGVTQNSAAWNAAALQDASQNNDLALGAVATGDAEQQAGFNQRLNAGNFNNAAQQQDYTQQLGRGQFAQAGIGQNNAAIGQNNAATLDMGSFHNNAQGQQNAQNAAAAGFYNQANLAGATFANQAQQQQYTEGMGINNNLINQISALRGGGQVTSPQFGSYTAGTLDQTPYASSVYNSAAIDQAQYQTQVQAQSANNAALGQILGAGLGMFKFGSDRRLKRDIEMVGTGPNGLNLYLYQYRGRPGFWLGFMADEVEKIRPDAVSNDDDGYALVDYAKAVA